MARANEANNAHRESNPDSILLRAKDDRELLDVIDSLRSQGISHYISLPQIVVVGDQSSGKSSVLEAISGVGFPVKDNLETRFPTELILRRDEVESAVVEIRPGENRTENETAKFKEFRTLSTSIDDVPHFVEKAKGVIGVSPTTKGFSDDVLVVQISGPHQPHLTLVDLPGLTHAESKNQSIEEVELVKNLVLKYMKDERSIILAVISAKNDFNNQVVTQLSRRTDIDPKGLRTLGIITKPDMLHPGSDSERAYRDLARNEDVNFGLGWHLLRNRDYNERALSVRERDERENHLFSRGIWTSLPLNCLGIGTLRPRLSSVLKDHILRELPQLIRDVEDGIHRCRERLEQLGDARDTIVEQRIYLTRISEAFSNLVKASMDGTYTDDFFGDAMTVDGYNKRLRAKVQNSLRDFARDMRLRGHREDIVDSIRGDRPGFPKQISMQDYTQRVLILMTRSRGRELPGTFNPMIIGDLFFHQSAPWSTLVDQYCNIILDATRECVELALGYVINETTKSKLLRDIIHPALEACRKLLQEKVTTMLEPHRRGHAITYNHYFTDTIQNARRDHFNNETISKLNSFFLHQTDTGNYTISKPASFKTHELANALKNTTEADMDRYACSEAIYCMQAYYKVALKTIIDNFATLGIEHCVLHKLPSFFSSSAVAGFSETSIENLAAETESAQLERATLNQKLVVLEMGLRTLNHLDEHKAMAYRHNVTTDTDTDTGSGADGLENMEDEDTHRGDSSSPEMLEVDHDSSAKDMEAEPEVQARPEAPTSPGWDTWGIQPKPSKIKKMPTFDKAEPFPTMVEAPRYDPGIEETVVATAPEPESVSHDDWGNLSAIKKKKKKGLVKKTEFEEY